MRELYDEARRVGEESARSAAALLRVAVERICKHLGEGGKTLNDAIGALVKKGLGVDVQQALDVVRVIGNNAVHPGELDFNDTHDVCIQLFVLVNMIVDGLIVQPKTLSQLFGSLPSQNF